MERVKIIEYKHEDGTIGMRQYHFYCEGCGRVHALSSDIHQFNGNLELPTFSPSVLFDERNNSENIRCHSFVVDGKIKYLTDSTHKLSGDTVMLKTLEEWKY